MKKTTFQEIQNVVGVIDSEKNKIDENGDFFETNTLLKKDETKQILVGFRISKGIHRYFYYSLLPIPKVETVE